MPRDRLWNGGCVCVCLPAMAALRAGVYSSSFSIAEEPKRTSEPPISDRRQGGNGGQDSVAVSAIVRSTATGRSMMNAAV